MPVLNELQKKLAGADVQVVGISCDTTYALKDWVEHLGGLDYPLASDFWPHGAVARTYGVMDEEKGRASRSIFVIDQQGIVRYIDRHALTEVPDPVEIEEELAKIA
ncbi:MAG: redoxin domain-containing protein [Chloroflexi bacterium]|nr:redoxin domain-containing protein [Chloroflexota bacterium]